MRARVGGWSRHSTGAKVPMPVHEAESRAGGEREGGREEHTGKEQKWVEMGGKGRGSTGGRRAKVGPNSVGPKYCKHL